MIMLAGYSYLGLIDDPRLCAAAIKAIEEFGVGVHGTRINCGTLDLHEQLEKEISSTNLSEATILYPSGFQANFSTIAALVDKEDVIFSDALNHASIIDGCKLSGAHLVVYRHCDMDDLREKLRDAGRYRNRLVITDGVFSMDGDVAPIPQLLQLCKEHHAALMVDEAHSLGVLGARGFGVVEHFGLGAGDIDIITGVLSKALPGTGGYASGSVGLVDFLKHSARSYIFSGGTTPAQAASSLAAIEILKSDRSLVETLWRKTRLFHGHLKDRQISIGDTVTPITPIMIPDAKACIRAAHRVQMDGVFLVAVPFPVVPFGKSRLRATVTAAHDDGDLVEAADIIARAIRG
jgi:glycine C-acetyltransferase